MEVLITEIKKISFMDELKECRVMPWTTSFKITNTES